MIPGNPDEQQSNHHNHNLFEISSQPSWVYDIASLRFLDVNEAAIAHYGYSRNEFLSMTLRDVRPVEEILPLEEAVELVRGNLSRPLKKFTATEKRMAASSMFRYKVTPIFSMVSMRGSYW